MNPETIQAISEALAHPVVAYAAGCATIFIMLRSGKVSEFILDVLGRSKPRQEHVSKEEYMKDREQNHKDHSAMSDKIDKLTSEVSDLKVIVGKLETMLQSVIEQLRKS